jgi:two-component system chemotaxis response regulator CheB
MAKNILLAESSSLVRRYLLKLLQAEGYIVESVKTKEKLLQQLRQKSYRLVIVDIAIEESLEAIEEVIRCGVSKVMALYAPTQRAMAEEARNLGALEVIQKPQKNVDIADIADELLAKIKGSFLKPTAKLLKKQSFKESCEMDTNKSTMGFVLIGASTGGPRLIEKICKSLPVDYPHAVCVVQHMPTDFTTNFAKRLNSICKLEVVEAENGLALKSGRVIIAKGENIFIFVKN